MENDQQPLSPFSSNPTDGRQPPPEQPVPNTPNYTNVTGAPSYPAANRPASRLPEYDFIINTPLPGQKMAGPGATSAAISKRPIILMLVSFGVFLLIIVLLAAARPRHTTPSSSASSSTALHCTPPASNAADEKDAEAVFKTFALAIKQKNQPCADALSSNYFKQLQAQTFPGSNGKWITKSEGGLPSLAVRLADLPKSFTAANFKSSAYSRPETVGVSKQASDLPTGITLHYPVTDAYTKAKTALYISFISSNGKVVVDSLELGASSGSTTSDTNQSATSESTTAGSDTSSAAQYRQAEATGDIFEISLYLEDYFANYNAYPGDIQQATFTSVGIRINYAAFTPPGGVSFNYLPSPGGCTTASGACQHYVLEAIDTGTGSIIHSVTSAN